MDTTTKTSPQTKPTLAGQFRKQLPAYEAGDSKALDECFCKLKGALERDATDYSLLITSLIDRAIDKQNLPMLEKIMDLDPSGDLSDVTLNAAQADWKAGYDLLRPKNEEFTLIGMSLYTAFRMQDPGAYENKGTKLFKAQSVDDFMALVRRNGASNDAAIDFLNEVGLGWAIDYGLGLADEWSV